MSPSLHGQAGGVRTGAAQRQHTDLIKQNVLLSRRPVQTRLQDQKGAGGPSSPSTTTRKGFAVTEAKGALKPWTYEVPAELGSDEIDIKVTHNGVCGSDLSMRDDGWGLSKFPFIPGHEVVGIVAARGKGVTELQIGDRVGVGWIKNSCRRCLCCLRGEENLCAKGYTGTIVLGNHGGFQETMRTPADFAYPIPEGMDSADAAPLLCAGATVYAPLRKHIHHPGQKVAILGIGGLGHLAIQFAAAMGVQVTAIDIAPAKAEEAAKLGASKFIAWTDTANAIPTDGTYFDLLINCASGGIDAGLLMDTLANDGTLVQVGIPGGGVKMTVPLQNLVFGQKKLAGSIVAGRADMMEMLRFATDKNIKPMLTKMPLSKVNEAMQAVREGKVRYRVVLESDY